MGRLPLGNGLALTLQASHVAGFTLPTTGALATHAVHAPPTFAQCIPRTGLTILLRCRTHPRPAHSRRGLTIAVDHTATAADRACTTDVFGALLGAERRARAPAIAGCFYRSNAILAGRRLTHHVGTRVAARHPILPVATARTSGVPSGTRRPIPHRVPCNCQANALAVLDVARFTLPVAGALTANPVRAKARSALHIRSAAISSIPLRHTHARIAVRPHGAVPVLVTIAAAHVAAANERCTVHWRALIATARAVAERNFDRPIGTTIAARLGALGAGGRVAALGGVNPIAAASTVGAIVFTG